MYDEMTTLGNSKIQHGKFNDRIYLYKLGKNDIGDITTLLDKLAQKEMYTKIFAKIPMKNKQPFLVSGFRQEGKIPNFYSGEEDASFMGKYFSPSRSDDSKETEIQEIISLAKSKAESATCDDVHDSPFEIRRMSESDAHMMSVIYKKVFQTYPFPIHEVEYLKETMADNVHYYGAVLDDKIVALASSELDFEAQNVEMTDFATLPEYLGNGLAVVLLKYMEKALENGGIKTAYTIARALSPGMNITFAKLGYEYGGTLINNTNISGSIESMNIWYKALN